MTDYAANLAGRNIFWPSASGSTPRRHVLGGEPTKYALRGLDGIAGFLCRSSETQDWIPPNGTPAKIQLLVG